MGANQILQFGTTASGGNILTQSAYSADAQRLTGHQPGIARQELENKALLQLSTIAAGVAQFIADRQATDVTDSLTPAQIASMLADAGQGRFLARRVFATPGTTTYTPTAGTRFIVVLVQAGGGGGGGSAATGAGQCAAGAGGGGGGWAILRINSGFSGQTITVGAAGAAGLSGAAGGSGGSSSLGALVSATGGSGGSGGAAASSATVAANGAGGGGLGSNGDINGRGGFGAYAIYCANPVSGKGGFSYFGEGAGWVVGGFVGGVGAVNYGAGGSGSAAAASNGAASGGAGFQGVVIIDEFA